MLVATPGHAIEWRATIEPSTGRGLGLPDEAPFINRAIAEERAVPWPL